MRPAVFGNKVLLKICSQKTPHCVDYKPTSVDKLARFFTVFERAMSVYAYVLGPNHYTSSGCPQVMKFPSINIGSMVACNIRP